MFKTFKEWLEDKGVNKTAFEAKEVAEQANLQKEYMGYVSTTMKENGATKEDLSAIETKLKDLATAETVSKLENSVEEALEGLNYLKDKQASGFGLNSVVDQINKFIGDNHDKIKSLKSQGNGMIELVVKAPTSVTTGSATNPDDIPELAGVQQAAPSTVNLRSTFVQSLTSNFNTSLAAYPYTESLPKDGDYAFVAEGTLKPQIDFKIESRYAQPSKIAAWIHLSDESIEDIPGLQSIANDYLRKKHDLKKQNGLLFGTGVSPEPKGATVYGRTFVAGSMATAITNPNFMDIVNAAVTDVYTTHNYQDEMAYMPSLVVINPIDFFIQFTSAKDADGKPLYPTAAMFSVVNVGGMTIMPERAIPAGKIFVADMSKYNTTNYIDYTVKIGWINDDMIKNQFVMLGESRFHAFVKKLDEQAFLYDDIATIKTAITAP